MCTHHTQEEAAGGRKGGLLVGVDLSKARAAAAAKQRKREEAEAFSSVALAPAVAKDPYGAASRLGLGQGQGPASEQGRLIVIDAANVAMRHGEPGQSAACCVHARQPANQRTRALIFPPTHAPPFTIPYM